jgi:hypothetical protein
MMRTSRAAALAAVIVLGLLPVTADAQHRSHTGRAQRHHAHQHHRPQQHHHHPQQHHHRFHHRPLGARVVVAPFVPFVSYAAPSVVYVAPPVYAPPYYAPPPVVYVPPPAYAAAPYAGPSLATYAPPAAPAHAPPPAPAHAPPSQDLEPLRREVAFPSGRYVLRGDGTSTPYTWVWIPNPPSAPPNGTPAATRDEARPLYAWTDANGVTTWTDRLSKVPPAHRANARRTF